jgi:calcineurin-like phosphoesterase family protein
MIYFTSDQHYSHKNVIKYCKRPFTRHAVPIDPNTPPPFSEKEKLAALELDVLEMNEELVKRHNETVSPSDTVYHLGDFSLSKYAVRKYLPRLKGTHYLIQGNHDYSHPVISKTPQELVTNRKIYTDSGFKDIFETLTMNIKGEDVIMSHFPYLDPNPKYAQKYPDFRFPDNGLVLLHGHVHDSWSTKYSPKGTLMINVGVDVWDFRPVSIEAIASLIKGLK